jgi:hypothetical protein
MISLDPSEIPYFLSVFLGKTIRPFWSTLTEITNTDKTSKLWQIIMIAAKLVQIQDDLIFV